MTIHLVVPALKVAGGILETCALARDIAAGSADVRIVSMWSAEHPVASPVPVDLLSDWRPRGSRAPVQLPLLAARFRARLASRRRGGQDGSDRYIFTHYATFPLSAGLRPNQRLYFVQDLEWQFLAHPMLRSLLRRYILASYRQGHTIAANTYLARAVEDLGCGQAILAPIWADARFRDDSQSVRDLDLVMVLRKGAHKRLDLYLEFIRLAKQRTGLRLAAISPESDILDLVRDQVDLTLLRPSLEQMRAVYARTWLFVHLSEHEGFGLPPLEAMGAGCIPLCRDSGGVRAYMLEPGLHDLLVPLHWSVPQIVDRARSLLTDPEQLSRLRGRARAVFDGGLDTTAKRRAAVAAILSL